MIVRKRDAPVFIKNMYNMVLVHNRNFLCACAGQTGSGKSYAVLGTAESYSKRYGVPFSVDNVVFRPLDLIRLINRGLPRGSVIILDESGVAFGARDWMTKVNKLLGSLMQTFRHRNYIVFLCVPNLDFMDKTGRTLLHCYMETSGIDYEKEVCYVKPKFLEINKQTGRTYYKYLQFKQPGFPAKRLSKMGIKKPSEVLLAAYEKKKNEFTDRLNAEIEKELAGTSELDLKDKQPLNLKQFLVVKIRNRFHALTPDIALATGATRNAVNEQLKQARRKGYDVFNMIAQPKGEYTARVLKEYADRMTALYKKRKGIQ